LGIELRDGSVTRDILAYTITAGADTATVILGAIEELGLRMVEHADVVHGRVTPKLGNGY
jgi:hypothetical protein